jgi:hypothetical protein
MKKSFKLIVILLALTMQAIPVCADDDNEGSPLELYSSRTPKVGDNIGPRRAPANPTPLYMDIFLNLTDRTIELYDSEGSIIAYHIYNVYDVEVCSGIISFVGNEQAVISLASLPAGIYYLDIIQNGITYEGEFALDE